MAEKLRRRADVGCLVIRRFDVQDENYLAVGCGMVGAPTKRPRMFTAIRQGMKDLFFGVENPVVRLVLDEVLRRRGADRIALSDPRRVHESIRGSLQRELERVLNFGTEFETELYVRRFETEFAKRCGRRHAVGTHSGTSALQLALAALNIGPGDEVITSPYTYIATALAISNTGAKPVFVDIDEASFILDPARIEAAITARTKAIVPVHLFGQVAAMPEIVTIAARHGLRVVEDACQAFGAELHGRMAGSFGDIGCFSFSTPKTLSGFGNGGMVVCDDRVVAERIRTFRNPEANDPALLRSRRTPCYLDPIQIAFIRAKLPSVPAWIERRQAHAAAYRTALESFTELQLPGEVPGARPAYYRFAVRTRRRSQLGAWLNRAGIRAVAGYSPCLHLTRTYAELGYAAGSFPRAEAVARDTLLLPVAQFLTDDERATVSDAVRRFFSA